MTWEWVRHRGPAQTLHDLAPPAPWRRLVWVLDATDRAVVLGSSQPDDVSREAARRAGVTVARRRSGGGAVLVGPGEVVWVDVFVPKGDPLWHDDVGVATHWLGRVWADALTAAGVADPHVHDGPMFHRPDSRLVCFAGVGPGEVFVGDAKVVGISQRRSRAGARFQCAVALRWEPATWVTLLRPGPTAGLDGVAVGVGVEPTAVLHEFLAALPT